MSWFSTRTALTGTLVIATGAWAVAVGLLLLDWSRVHAIGGCITILKTMP